MRNLIRLSGLCGLILLGMGCAMMKPARGGAALPPPAAIEATAPGRQAVQSYGIMLQIPERLNYLLYLPENYDQSKEHWPLVLFLHGAGERGNDPALLKLHGIPKRIAEGQQFPFVMVAPQCPKDGWWPSRVEVAALQGLLDEIEAHYRIDPDRIYVTGLSMGGFGTWALALAMPQRFAALAPICGEGSPERAAEIARIPEWVFHGEKDPLVNVKGSKEMVEALKKAGAPKVKLTLYPEAGHDCWTETYANPELYTWLLSHRRGGAAQTAK